jgi:hypothetical protein
LTRHSGSTSAAGAASAGSRATKVSGRCACGGRGTCRSCTQRRLRAWRLVARERLTEAEAAKRMGSTVAQVRLLLAQERDYQELKAFKRDSIETATVRAFVDREFEHDPELSRSLLAHWLNMQQVDLDRQLGYSRGRGGRMQRRIGIPAASKVVIALGRAPHELDGC